MIIEEFLALYPTLSFSKDSLYAVMKKYLILNVDYCKKGGTYVIENSGVEILQKFYDLKVILQRKEAKLKNEPEKL